jgi:hypothetical protein
MSTLIVSQNVWFRRRKLKRAVPIGHPSEIAISIVESIVISERNNLEKFENLVDHATVRRDEGALKNVWEIYIYIYMARDNKG